MNQIKKQKFTNLPPEKLLLFKISSNSKHETPAFPYFYCIFAIDDKISVPDKPVIMLKGHASIDTNS